PAASMPRVEAHLIAARAKRLRAAADAALSRHLSAQVGKTLTLLTEQGGMARAEDFTRVRVGDVPAGRLMAAEIVGHDGKMLVGRPAIPL
ncbi:MAG: tRNA (N(6)-L-threonylcarbamoyladenosine(37)-C(2))-methylthiotransferase MtaB, partial [Methylovirgula sp.]